MNALSGFGLLLAALLPGLSKGLRDNVIEKIIHVASLVERLGVFLKDDLFDRILPKARKPIISQQALQNALSNTFKGINDGFNLARTTLQEHGKSIGLKIEPEDSKRPWRMFGYLFQMIILGLFIYADLVQMINNLAPQFPGSLSTIPAWLGNLPLSLLMSSVGTAIAAGLILADFGEITYFGRWKDIKNDRLRNVVYGLTWACFIFVLIIDAILAVSRIAEMPNIVKVLPPEFITYLTVAAGLSSNLAVLPMIVITLLFFGGFVGLVILYIVLMWVISLVVGLIHFIFLAIVWLFTFGISYLVDFLLRVTLFIIVALLFMLGWFFTGSGLTLEKGLEVLQAILNVLYFPMDAIVEWIKKKLGM
jgi:hypothetical protein